MADKTEWVEIIEPITKDIMFANIRTGECVWDQPDESERILSINEQAINSGVIQHQWWELFDIKSSRFFYYNDRTSETTWHKPKDKNVIILPLSKFQLGQAGVFKKKLTSSSNENKSSNKLKISDNGEVILKRDCSTQTNLTNIICHNVSTQTSSNNQSTENLDDSQNKSFSFSSYIDQFEQLTNKSSKSNKSNKSSTTTVYSNCYDTNCKKNNCRSLRHYLMNEAKFAGVYDDKQYWNENKFQDDVFLNSGDSSTDQCDADDEENDIEGDFFYSNQNKCSNDEDDFEQNLDDDSYINNNLNSQSDSDENDLANYFRNENLHDLETNSRLKKFSAQLEKKRLMLKNKNNAKRKIKKDSRSLDEDDIDEDDVDEENDLEDEDEEIEGEDEEEEFSAKESEVMKNFSCHRKPKDPNDYLETSSFIFLNKAASFVSSDDISKKPVPLKRVSSIKKINADDSLKAYDYQALRKKSSDQVDGMDLPNNKRLIILPNSSSVLEKAEILNPMGFIKDTIVDVSDLLKKELPSKPKKDIKKKQKEKFTNKADENKPKPPKRCNSLDLPPTDILNSLKIKDKKELEKKLKKNAKNEELEKFAKENIKRHLKKGGLNQVFKRKESIKGMLVWTKSSIKQPMIASLLNDSELKQEAINCFKLIQQYCGDRDPKNNDTLKTSSFNESSSLASFSSILNKEFLQNKEIAYKIIECAITRGTHMKDEIFIQLCRQTTENPNEESLHSGLLLMTICLYYFTASSKFTPYLYSFLSNHKSEFAKTVCLRKFKKKMDLTTGGSNSNSYCKKPLDPSEIEMVAEAIDKKIPGIFGEPLEELLKEQSKRWQNRKLPWIQVTLSETILRLGGNEQEGIFRIAGDVEEMNFLKLYLDCLDYEKYADNCDFIDIMNSWKYCAMNREHKDEISPIDVHAIACLLKQWFRELPEPLIPYELYNEALESCDDPSKAICIIETKLPQLNKLVIGYLIRFLQIFSAKQNVELTKMDENNLSMIWAPNLLLTPKGKLPTNPSEIFDNTRREMTFIRTLIQSLDTSYIQGII